MFSGLDGTQKPFGNAVLVTEWLMSVGAAWTEYATLSGVKRIVNVAGI